MIEFFYLDEMKILHFLRTGSYVTMSKSISKIIASMLVMVMSLCLVACGQTQTPSSTVSVEPEGMVSVEDDVQPEVEPQESDEEVSYDFGDQTFNEALVSFVDAEGMSNKNYMISPVSYRAALCLALAGAEGDTLEELLNACQFDSVEEAESWYKGLVQKEKDFAEACEANKWDGSFSIVNSVWNNETMMGDFTQAYLDYVTKEYGAEAYTTTADKIVNEINAWCKEKTNGMIPHVVDNIEDATAVLVNALYLRSSWWDEFPEHLTHDAEFTGYDGSTTTMSFMEQTDHFNAYQDEETSIVVLPLRGNKEFVLVMGDKTNLKEKMSKLETKLVHLVMPKFETSATFESPYMVGFLKAAGVKTACDSNLANFSKMCEDVQWYISDIIQKDKIKVDETGLEAAAVTAITVKANSAIQAEDPIEIIADHPFSYYIYTDFGTDDAELLFYGQLVSTVDE